MMNWLPFKDAPQDGSSILVWASTMNIFSQESQGPHITYWNGTSWERKEEWYKPTKYCLIEPPNI